ncbi:GNAT family N-acetyltransferase [Evansella clarkii]|uniref:GNAT family N-acetyltransferase n=1 Tax=Evansella clarkii TaxID=79879 RepID=UPI000B434449|nr:GNAT family N-acetyltransferase [Evansella clarkii]
MSETIRKLSENDFHFLKAMDTGIEDDYVERIFDRLTSGTHHLYGMFDGDHMICMGGYTIFAGKYAMLGRLRCDQRFRGKNNATKLIASVMDQAYQEPGIKWVGANTQEENIPARRVLEKLGLPAHTPRHGAVTKETTVLGNDRAKWIKIESHQRKKDWLEEIYIENSAVFPYEVYYSFPASEALFREEKVSEWSFYENEAGTRLLITKEDQKKYNYLHAVYPWDDLAEQQGLWETIKADYEKLAREKEQEDEEETYIWMDLTKTQAAALPARHEFKLPSPWILHGAFKEDWQKGRVGGKQFQVYGN